MTTWRASCQRHGRRSGLARRRRRPCQSRQADSVDVVLSASALNGRDDAESRPYWPRSLVSLSLARYGPRLLLREAHASWPAARKLKATKMPISSRRRAITIFEMQAMMLPRRYVQLYAILVDANDDAAMMPPPPVVVGRTSKAQPRQRSRHYASRR